MAINFKDMIEDRDLFLLGSVTRKAVAKDLQYFEFVFVNYSDPVNYKIPIRLHEYDAKKLEATRNEVFTGVDLKKLLKEEI